MRIRSFGLSRLWILRELNYRDLIDGKKLIRQIAAVQVLSGDTPGQTPFHDWREVRGLFFTPGNLTFQDTYYSLAALESRRLGSNRS
jgi:hypothetical protein